MYAIKYTSTAGGIEKNFDIKKDAPQPPALKKGETLVQVTCAALNPVDYKFPEAPLLGRLAVGVPATPGLDFAGVVASTKKEGLKEGQRVFGRLGAPCKFGVVAEYTLAPFDGCIAMPEGVSFAQAAALGTAALTAWQTIAPYVKDKPSDQRLFINGGSGGVGTYAIQIAKALGCYVTTTCSSKNAAFCKELGADEVIEYNSVDVCQTLIDKVKTDPASVYDHAVDNVGTPEDIYKAADHYLKAEGRFVQIGAGFSASGIVSAANRAMKPGFLGGGKRKWEFYAAANKAEDFEELARLMKEGKVRSVIDEMFKFEDASNAYEKLKTGRAKGKIIVNVSDA